MRVPGYQQAIVEQPEDGAAPPERSPRRRDRAEDYWIRLRELERRVLELENRQRQMEVGLLSENFTSRGKRQKPPGSGR